VGIGTSTIESYWSGYTALKVGYNNSIFGNTADSVGSAFFISQNLYNDGGNYRYVGSGSDEGGLIDLRGGAFVFSNAPLGTAGNVASIVPRLTISSVGAATFQSASAKSLTGSFNVSINDSTAFAQGVGGGITLGGYKGATAQEFFAAIDAYKENGTSGNAAGAFRILTQPSDGSGLAERLRISSGGLVSIPNGIVFNNNTTGGTPNATGVTLNDYEEGTWSALYKNNTGDTMPVGATTDSNCEYTRIGNKVYISGYIDTSGGSSVSGAWIVLDNLPFAPDTSTGFWGGITIMTAENFAGDFPSTGLISSFSTSSFKLHYRNASDGGTLQRAPSDLSTASGASNRIRFHGFYSV